MKNKIKETDLFQPIKEHFEGLGYTVNAEVKGCDVTAIKDNELIIIELKLQFGLQLLYQAAERQYAADKAYVAIPCPPKGKWNKNWKKMCHLLKRLEIGLIIIHFKTQKPIAEVIFDPASFEEKRLHRKRSSILKEASGRSLDNNKGGSVKSRLMTAYRDNSVQIACYLEEMGTLSPKRLRELGTGEKTYSILYDNVYGWFEHVDKGLYGISTKWDEDKEKYCELVKLYKKMIQYED